MKNFNILFVPALISTCLFSSALLAEHNERQKTKHFYVEGRVSTGYNMSKGKPMYDLGGIIGAPAFHYTFAYETNSSEPSHILEDTDENRLVATGIDPRFYVGVGVDPGLINQDVVNLPYRALPFTIDGNTAEAATLKPISSENYKTDFTYSTPSKPITIKDWYSAKGMSHVTCYSSTKAKAEFKFKDLIPNGVYAVWTIIGEDKDGDGVRDFFSPKAFGGAPNIFSADSKGQAVFERTVPYCPNTDNDTMSVEVTYHVDGATYGAVPSISPAVSSGNSYLSAPVHMAFNLGGLEEAN